jgi:cell division protein FtsZ
MAPAPARPAPVYELEPALSEPALPAAAYHPSEAERAVVRPARMPRVEELPAPAQAQIRARAELEAQDHKRRTLLQRLATVGFGRRDDGPPVAAPAAAPFEPPPPPRIPVEAARPPLSPVHAEYARRPQPAPPLAPQPVHRAPPAAMIEPPGRAAAVPQRSMDDDQLEIPAFLRRQAN